MDEPSSSSTTVEETGGIKPGAFGKLLVNRQRQWGNPVLKYIRNVAYEWTEEIEADFEAGRGCAVLYLSLKWHKLHPGYIETRMNSDARSTALKVSLKVGRRSFCHRYSDSTGRGQCGTVSIPIERTQFVLLSQWMDVVVVLFG